jgi:carbamoyl-phosphate synthase large subunit
MSRARVLLTTAGRKSYLAPLLRQSPNAGWVGAVDIDPSSPIRSRVDAFDLVPPVAEGEAFVAAVHQICLRDAIDCVLPQNDLELEALARARARFEKDGIRVAGLAPELVRTVTDKLALADWLGERGHRYPDTQTDLPSPTAGGRWVEKERHGQGSAGLAVHDAPPLRASAREPVFQPFVEGEEFNLDVLRDAFGDVVAVCVKRKLLMVGGSTDRAVSVDDPELAALGVQLADDLSAFGSIDVDVLRSESGPVVLDINPRMGGGFPFTATLCPAYVDCLLDVCTGRPVGPRFPKAAADRVVCREFTFTMQPDPRTPRTSPPAGTGDR